MAKVQGKKASTTPKKGAGAKPVTRAKTAKPAGKKPAARVVAKAKPAASKKPAKAAPKKPAAKKPAPKKAAVKAAPKKTAKTAAKPAARKPASKPAVKTTPKPSPKTAAKPASKPSPKAAAKPAAKPVAKAEKAVEKVKAAVKSVAKAAAGAAATVVRAVAPAVDEKKKRRSRTRVTSSGPATAAWFSQGDRPRSSSFIPAPPRAEAPSLVAAPPASSDRLVGSHELTEFAVRTQPVRIDIESSGGRIYLSINPNETNLREGEGIEWDFRYLGGADVVIEEIVIEFAKPSPFTTAVFRSRRPGAARPHRQLSGPAQTSAAGKRLQYTVRAFNAFKTEMAVASPAIVVA
ncbi:MAG: hypothetical protein QOC81_5122 [Thermoanaerobaculia bacterium]|jgi:hypothetical protein|nr:hypothetical protein [Thermoanaerobaculia bacterium]